MGVADFTNGRLTSRPFSLALSDVAPWIPRHKHPSSPLSSGQRYSLSATHIRERRLQCFAFAVQASSKF